ncbi:hypothetical protein UFOVP449_234 [uncultured Caudovirales phage]|uniref:Uncharacterized protein n=1 Tax=uncultured Caudovirales phage TaxID=2100421 RepID=A0A6J5MET4_9CAUD|nr:hypothetical protein UFOVP449_234 [uncultured Caudovirales phage]
MSKILIGLSTVIGVLVVIALLMGLPLMLLWNYLMPDIFGLTKITFWQAVGINFLASILFNKHYNSEKNS